MSNTDNKLKGKKTHTAYKPPNRFPKSLWFDLSRKEEWEAMAAKDGKKLAGFIQDNVGNFSEVEAFVKDAIWQLKEKKKLIAKLKHPGVGAIGVIDATLLELEEIAAFIEALKTK